MSGQDDFEQRFWRGASSVPVALDDLAPGEVDGASFRLLADNIPTLCWIANGDGYIVWYNRRWHAYCGTTPEQMEGWGWQSVHDPDQLPAVMERWAHSIASGEPFEMTFPLKGGDGVFRPFLTRIQPVRDASGRIARWFGVNTEISSTVAAERALRVALRDHEALSAERDAILSQLSEGVIVADRTGRLTFVNAAAERLHGVKALDVAPEDYSETYHLYTEDGLPYPPEQLPLARAALRGETVLDARWRIRRPDGTDVLAIGSAQPLVVDGEQVGAVLTVRDDTERHDAEVALKDREMRSSLALRATNDAIWDWDLSTDQVIWNEALLSAYGYRPEEVENTADWWVGHIHPEDRDRIHGSIFSVIHGSEERWADEYRFARADGSWAQVFDRGSVLRDGEGRARRMIGAMQDLTEQQRTERKLRAETRSLEALNRTALALAGELDLERAVQAATDSGVELSGAQFGAFFYNVTDPSGESFMLYTLSGASRSDFENFGMPRNTQIFAPTFNGDGTVRSDDITRDPRYGRNAPHRGMPEGHLPVRSYLAVPVISRSGDVLGGLFFGHEEVGCFTERHERLLEGIAAQSAVAIDNAGLFAAAQHELKERSRAEAALRDLNQSLEARVEAAIRAREQVEDALRQAQKMEAVGQLTGGIAHDFNNLLTVVLGNIDLVLRSLDAEAPLRQRRMLEGAQKGAERAAALTQRLLAFSRRQPLTPRPLNVDELVRNMSELIGRSLGETIRLSIVSEPDPWQAEVDANQLEAALLNLAVNARDAMPKGGDLTIEVGKARLDQSYAAANAGAVEGDYVMIAVSDTGHGISRDILDKVFEPFFTTKEVGKGTGLGLSMVYGFVKQSGGHIKIYSEPGEGTSVKLYLPRLITTQIAEASAVGAAGSLECRGRGELIMVVEDDEDVRAYTITCMQELGYRVAHAPDGVSALRIYESLNEPVALLFTDVVMPEMSGKELAMRLSERQPDLRVLYTSGYTRNAIVHGGRLDPGVEMLGKPFTLSDLSEKLRKILGDG